MTSFLRKALACAMVMALGALLMSSGAQAKDKLLDEVVEFTGALLFLQAKVPGLVIGAVRNGETSITGFGQVSDQENLKPDGKTILRIGSITKVFTGAVLASLVADGTVKFTDPLQKHLNWGVDIPVKDGRQIRLIDLVTHTSGLPREIERPPSPHDNPFQTITKEAMIANLRRDPLLFPPGTGALYSNFAFDLLAQALGNAARKPYADLLSERILLPRGLGSTAFSHDAQQKNLMQGHDFDGKPLPEAPTSPMIVGAGGLYSTADDMLRWIAWHLDQFATADAEMHLLDHAAYIYRDGLSPVFGLDESGRMDAMALGWIIMMPRTGSRSFCRRRAACKAFSAMSLLPLRMASVFSSPSINSIWARGSIWRR